MKISFGNNKIPACCVLFILLLNFACEKDNEYESLTGQLIGYVSLYDGLGKSMDDNSGVTVTAEGSDPRVTAITDEKGKFTIDNLHGGTYNIIFTKEGYYLNKFIGYQFVGGTKPATLYRSELFRQTHLQINDLAITPLENPYSVEFNVTANISGSDKDRPFYSRYYISNLPGVSYKNYISTYVAYNNFNENTISFYLPVDTLQYPVGSKLYLIMYPTASSNQSYTDIDTGKQIYTTVNTDESSDVVSVTIPKVESPW